MAIKIEGGAHHLDLRLPNEEDPEQVTWSRDQEDRIIGGWISAYQGDSQLSNDFSDRMNKYFIQN